MLLAGRDEEKQTRARELGHRLALAIRAHAEKIMFISRGQRHPELLEHIRGHNEDLCSTSTGLMLTTLRPVVRQ